MKKTSICRQIEKEEKLLKRSFVIMLTIVFVLGITTVALAFDGDTQTPGTYTESAPDNTSIPISASVAAQTKYGASAWVYKDSADDNFKFEGSYRRFQNQADSTTTVQGGVGAGFYDFDGDASVASADTKDSGPHGGYDTGSNKCKTCHAVHRANGTYRLMRVDSPEDACNYCHIGDHKHSLRGAYYRSGDALTYASNGHTMGAGMTIPDSTVKQWLEPRTLTTTDSDGNTSTVTYLAREYSPNRNKMFYWTTKRSSYHDNGWMRLGPTYLSCISCHQPHNASELIWKPGNTTTTLSNGYKLLRAAPSGSAKSTARMVNYGVIDNYVLAAEAKAAGATTITIKAQGAVPMLYPGDVLHVADANHNTWNEVIKSYNSTTKVVEFEDGLDYALATNDHMGMDESNIIRVPANAINATTTGSGTSTAGDGSDVTQNFATTWTKYKGASFTPLDGNVPRLSVWCADCHNLNIGHYESITGTATNFRSKEMHGDRTHTSTNRIECWNCHSSNMPVTDDDFDTYMGTTGNAAGCQSCHYYSGGNSYYQKVRWNVPKSDFPHSGAPTGYKLLTEGTANNPHGVTASEDPSFDAFCTRCHDLIGEKM